MRTATLLVTERYIYYEIKLLTNNKPQNLPVHSSKLNLIIYEIFTA